MQVMPLRPLNSKLWKSWMLLRALRKETSERLHSIPPGHNYSSTKINLKVKKKVEQSHNSPPTSSLVNPWSISQCDDSLGLLLWHLTGWPLFTWICQYQHTFFLSILLLFFLFWETEPSLDLLFLCIMP